MNKDKMKDWLSNKGKIPAQWQKNFDLKSLADKMRDLIMDLLKSAPEQPATSPGSRHMKYPYTFSAKLVQFPYKYYYKHCWLVRFYPWGLLGSVPVFWYISKIVNSKENKAVWKEIRRHEAEEKRHKFDYR